MAGRGGRGPSGASRLKSRGQKTVGLQGNPSESSEGSEDEFSSDTESPVRAAKRLRIDEGLLKRVQKINQQQQQQQEQKQQQRLLFVPEGAEKQQRDKAQQVQKQQQLHSKLIALRVCMNSVLRLSNNFPDAAVLQLLQQEQQQKNRRGVSLADVRKEAAETFVLLRRLQLLLLQQSSLATPYRTATGDSEATATAANAAGGWQQRREAHKQQQNMGSEADVWDLVGDLIFASGLRSVCIANADAWHQHTGSAREKSFSVFNQPVSVQLNNTMIGEEEKLLSRSVRSNHLMRMNTSNKGTDNHESYGKIRKDECAVVGCTELRRADREMQHTHYDDTDFYVELLKSSVSSGTAEMDAAQLAKEKELLRSRRRDNAKDVDRRASKGRKIRYKPIPQLENFMAAEPWVPDTDALPGAGDPLVVESLIRNLFRDG